MDVFDQLKCLHCMQILTGGDFFTNVTSFDQRNTKGYPGNSFQQGQYWYHCVYILFVITNIDELCIG